MAGSSGTHIELHNDQIDTQIDPYFRKWHSFYNKKNYNGDSPYSQAIIGETHQLSTIRKFLL
jgi:hypothetical protein